jgi:penicillin-insensitive murein endopeptidase
MRLFLTAFLALLIGPAMAAPSSPPMPLPRPAVPSDSAAKATEPTKVAAPSTPDGAKTDEPTTKTPAKELFGRAQVAAPLAARAIGFYAKGCLAGGIALPVDGQTWQVMRLSRNRNWGHPDLIAMLERLAVKVPKVSNWNGILVGDLAQPRGGPMLTGHASHQLGLDADVWLTPMPDRRLSRDEREQMSATMMVRKDRLDIDPQNWTPGHMHVIKAAAEDPVVERVLVNAAIKKALCREAGTDRKWLDKVRPYWGHDYHMHIRIRCPAGSPDCEKQDPVPGGDGCGKELDDWFRPAIVSPPPPTGPPPKPKPPLTMADLPAACRQVLIAR